VNRAAFKDEARFQKVCAVGDGDCDDPTGPWHPHHVVYEQHVVSVDPRLRHDPDNALRVTVSCHGPHHSGQRRIRTRELRDENINFAVRLLGAGKAVNYLRRYYNDHSQDPRIANIERLL
jgi:hypothetical protein